MSRLRQALHVVNGERVDTWEGGDHQVRTVASTHYSGPADGSGTVTLVFTDGREIALPWYSQVRVA